jgi:hypothetical protein
MSGARETLGAGLGVPGLLQLKPMGMLSMAVVRQYGPWGHGSHPHHYGAATGFSNSGRYRLETSSLSVAGWPAAV